MPSAKSEKERGSGSRQDFRPNGAAETHREFRYTNAAETHREFRYQLSPWPESIGGQAFAHSPVAQRRATPPPNGELGLIRQLTHRPRVLTA